MTRLKQLTAALGVLTVLTVGVSTALPGQDARAGGMVCTFRDTPVIPQVCVYTP